jgi:hypothetical protein
MRIKAKTETSTQEAFHSESHRQVKDGMKSPSEYIPEPRTEIKVGCDGYAR